MKQKSILILSLLSAMLLSSCHKDNNNKPTKKTPKCKIITEIGGLNNYSFTYNSNGKVKTIAGGLLLTTFTYSGNTAIATIKDNNGNLRRKTTLTFNEDGMTTNARVEQYLSGVQSEFEYVYQGTQLIKTTVTDSSVVGENTTILTYTWAGGNPVSMTISNGNNETTYTREYYTDKPSQSGGYLRFSDLTGGMKTMLPKNLIKSDSWSAGMENYSYNFDNDGKVSDFTRALNNGNSWTYNLQYQCK